METQQLIEEAKFEILAGRYDRAENFLKQVLKKEPDNLEALFNMGLLYEITHKQFEALKYFKKVLEIEPSHQEARQHAERLSEF